MLSFDRWELRELPFDVRTLSELWIKLQEFPTLFTDSTRGDIQNWISCVRDESFAWYQIWEGGANVGIIYAQILDDKADLHVAFFDKKPAERKELGKFFCRFLFDSLPQVNKITAAIPAIYYGTWRLAKSIGMRWEGTLREDVSFNGRKMDVHLYGLLRSDLTSLEEKKLVASNGELTNGVSQR